MATTVIDVAGRPYQAVPRPDGTTAIYAPHGTLVCEPAREWTAYDTAGNVRALTNDPTSALGHFAEGLLLRPSEPGDVRRLLDYCEKLAEETDRA